eukprot:TRINITY_DN22724_c0_g3_i1.p1 TRINITY_DN22724_c0_g3~~TRINITY_DN22724_c0_g3_i1.p1  ORF type:complete len:225 (+),score=35.89 TRINITY_DN22724_c0_g3_i1:89-763(+)
MDYLHYPVENPNAPSLVRSSSTWMFGILCVQITVTFFRIIQLGDVVSGFFNGMCVFIGWYAWKRDMDITLVSLWGVLNTFMLVHDTVFSIGELLRYLLYLDFVRVAMVLAIPVADFLGVSFAWELFKDYERAGGVLKPLFASENIPIFAKNHGYDAPPAKHASSAAKEVPPQGLGKNSKGYGGYPGGSGKFAGAPGSVQEMQHPVDMLAAQQASKARKQSNACC